MIGRLENKPELATEVSAGQTVRVSEGDLFDFMYVLNDGTFFGNEVGQVMAPQMFEKVEGGRVRLKDE